jgi:type IV secretion system protein VirB10
MANEELDQNGIESVLDTSLSDQKPDAKKTEIDFTNLSNMGSKQTFVMIAIIVAVLAVVGGYFYFSSSDTEEKSDYPFQNKPKKGGNIPIPLVGTSAPSASQAIDEAELKRLAEERNRNNAPPLPPAPLPPPPVAPLPPAPMPAPSTNSQAALDQAKQAKVTSSIMLSGGGGGAKQSDKRDLDTNFVVQATTAKSVQVTKTGAMSLLIMQGKIMESVLETPLNTSFPGPIRAVISRDVYSEKGENVLIPRGSRVIGTLEGGYQPGQDRIWIKWNRIILPSGYDILVQDAPGTDSLGQLGVPGVVDRRFLSTVGNALLLSAVNVSVANALQKAAKIQPNTQKSTESLTGGTTVISNTDPTQQAAKQAVQDLSDTTTQWMKDAFINKPFITLQQGTIVKIFVNQDIVFPGHIASGINVLK